MGCAVMLAKINAKTNNDYYYGLDYAQSRFEDIWDKIRVGDIISVTLELCKGNMPNGKKMKE